MLPSNLQITFVWKNSSHISTTNKRENQTPKTNQLANHGKWVFLTLWCESPKKLKIIPLIFKLMGVQIQHNQLYGSRMKIIKYQTQLMKYT
jgi:hypothetical protein